MIKRKQQEDQSHQYSVTKKESDSPYSNSYVDNGIPALEDDIIDLIYQKDLNKDVVNQFLHFGDDSDCGGSGWFLKEDLNFPGPFYTADSDTCGTGIIEAPNNVIFDEHYREFVMIQPRNRLELLQVWNAAAVEVFGSYYCDGNNYWTVESVREWWSNREDLLEFLKYDDLIKANCNQEKRYKYYLEHFAEIDLRKYCFFLENGFYPKDQKLPHL